ncbi:unnamed protein product [Oreochromis niloticus]|nr:unnamed protein product [Mustela putorius furo]
MTRPVPRRHDWNPADSALYEQQEAALSRWAEALRGKQRLFAEREHVFEGTRLAHPPYPGSNATCNAYLPSDVDIGLTCLPNVMFVYCMYGRQGLSSRLRAKDLQLTNKGYLISGRASETPRSPTCCLTCTGAFAAESGRFTPRFGRSAPRSHTRRLIRRTSNLATAQRLHLPPRLRRLPRQRLSCLPRPLPLPGESGAHAAIIWTILSNSRCITHPVTISTPITQPFPACTAAQIRPSSSTVSPSQVKTAKAQPVPTTPPQMARAQPATTPVPAPRTRAAVTQSTSTPAPVSPVGVTGVQPPPVPVPAPRLRAARTQPDLPRGLEELTGPPATSPLHPPPDPAFHALALSLVRLAEVSPAQAPALLVQAVALSPSLAQSVAQPLATPTSAHSLALPTSVHPLASPVQSVNSPAVQLPLHPPSSSLSSLCPVTHPPSCSVPRPAATASRASCELSRSSARGFRARWPCSCCSITAGSHAVAWSSPRLLRPPGPALGFCVRHAVAQATFWTSTPAQWPPPSSSRPPTRPAQWLPPSSSRPPTGTPTLSWWFFLLAVGCRPVKGGVLSGFLGH